MADNVPAGLTRADGRSFGLSVGGVFLALAAIGALRHHVAMPAVLATLGVVLVGGGVAAPGAMVPVRSAWMRMAHGISRVTTPVVMGIIFFVALAPIGLIRRLVGKDTLRPSAGARTYWKSRADTPASDMTRQF